VHVGLSLMSKGKANRRIGQENLKTTNVDTILILGFGREGKAALAAILDATFAKYTFLEINTHTSISVADYGISLESLDALQSEFPQVKHWYLGETWLSHLSQYDLIIRSPGVPLRILKEHLSSLDHVYSGSELFLSTNRDKTWVITGTKGKSTSASILCHILKELGAAVSLGGNIGIPPVSMFGLDSELFILELSSYQLEGLKVSPKLGIFLNLYEEHLDYHGDFPAYGEAKANIAKHQSDNDICIYPKFSEIIANLLSNTKGNKVAYDTTGDNAWFSDGKFWIKDNEGIDKPLVDLSSCHIKGQGNIRNICAVLTALIVARDFNALPESLGGVIDWEKVGHSIASYKPLPHRLQEVVSQGRIFINDSISTVAESTINAIDAYNDILDTLILGGFDRGISYTAMYKRIVNSNIKTILFFPPSGARMMKDLAQNETLRSKNISLYEVSTMKEAVHLAKKHTNEGRACLLSPGAPSFPIFKNFEERGNLFINEVLQRF